MTTFAVTAVVSVCVYFTASSWYAQQQKAEVARVASTIADVSASAIAEPFRDGRTDVVDGLLHAILIDLDVAYVLLLDARGLPAVSIERRRGARDLSAESRARTGFSLDGAMYRARRSVIGSNGHDLIGTLSIGYELDAMHTEIRTARQVIALLALVVLFFAFASAHFLSKSSVEAIEHVASAAERIAAGHPSPGPTIKRSDELGRVSSALARIADALGAQRFSVVIENGTPAQETFPETIEETRVVTSMPSEDDAPDVVAEADDYRADLVCDPSGTILYVSHEARRTLGYSTHELVGAAISSVVHPEDRRVLRELMNAGVSGGDAVIRCARGDGSWRDISFKHAESLAPVENGDTHLVLIDAMNEERLKRRTESRFARSSGSEVDAD